jgi:hypothetical protein
VERFVLLDSRALVGFLEGMKTLLLLLVLSVAAPTSTATVPEPTLRAVRSLKYARSVERELGRVSAVAADAFETSKGNNLFEGPRSAEATMLLLWTIIYNESGIRPHIEVCDCTKGDGDCDHGHALGLPQLHSEWLQGQSASDVCSNRKLQMSLALTGPLAHAKEICGSSFITTLSAYNSPAAACAVTPYARTTYSTFQQLLQRAGIVVRVGPKKSWSADSR